MLQCLRQPLTNGGLEGMAQGQVAPARAPGAVLKELEQAVGSRQRAVGRLARRRGRLLVPAWQPFPWEMRKFDGNEEYLGKAMLSV